MVSSTILFLLWTGNNTAKSRLSGDPIPLFGLLLHIIVLCLLVINIISVFNVFNCIDFRLIGHPTRDLTKQAKQ